MTRIAILSDIHFGKFARSVDFAVPGEIVQDNSTGDMPIESGLVKLITKMKPTYFLVAGDLTSVGGPEEFHYCEQKIISIAEKAGVELANIICCLGNHDVDWNISCIAGVRLEKDAKTGRYEKISEEVNSCIIEKYRNIASSVAVHCFERITEPEVCNRGPMPYTGTFETDEFVVFVLSTGAFCTSEQEYSHGKLSVKQLEWFDKVSAKYKSDVRKKIVLMHHHPFNYAYPVPVADVSLLEEGADFVDVAMKNGVDIVIHGHRHHPRVETFQNHLGRTITFLCAGSLAVNAKHRSNGEIPNMIHFLDVDKEKDYYTLHNYKYTGPEGWKPVTRDKVTPIDAYMMIGKVFSEQDRIEAVQKMPELKEEFAVLKWDTLEESLRFMPCSELNELLISQLKDTHDIIGQFPNEIALKRRENR